MTHYSLGTLLLGHCLSHLSKQPKKVVPITWVFQLRVYFYHTYNNTTNFTILKTTLKYLALCEHFQTVILPFFKINLHSVQGRYGHKALKLKHIPKVTFKMAYTSSMIFGNFLLLDIQHTFPFYAFYGLWNLVDTRFQSYMQFFDT